MEEVDEHGSDGHGAVEVAEGDWCAVYRKTRPCKSIILEDSCFHGDSCFYAHSPEELRPLPPGKRPRVAAHWQGAAVSIGVVEHAMFWDLPPVETLDVVCNRASCLGNPFTGRWYAQGEPAPLEDDEGWRPAEHEELCAAFAEYLVAILDRGSEENMSSIVNRIARARSCSMAETWVAQRLQRSDVLGALDALGRRVAGGERLRLLCHCRPHVRCHTEMLKAHLEKQAPPPPAPAPPAALEHPGWAGGQWPGRSSLPKCARRLPDGGECPRYGRALNPGDMQLYCVQCWIHRGNSLKGQVAGEATSGCNAGWMPQRCLFHARGICRFGDQCVNLHDEPKEEPPCGQRPPCPFFVRNACKFGAQCYYQHVGQEGACSLPARLVSTSVAAAESGVLPEGLR